MAQIIGLFRLGRDAELRSTAGGDQVAQLALAYNYGKKGDDGKKPTQWIDASIWGQRAQSLAPYLTKGSLISATLDDVHVRTYDKKDGGGQGFSLTGRVSALEFAGGNKSEAAAPKPAAKPAAKAAPAQSSDIPFDDDLPPF